MEASASRRFVVIAIIAIILAVALGLHRIHQANHPSLDGEPVAGQVAAEPIPDAAD